MRQGGREGGVDDDWWNQEEEDEMRERVIVSQNGYSRER
jgi:hypothetical protein